MDLFPLCDHAGTDGLRLSSKFCTVFAKTDMSCNFFVRPVQDDEGDLMYINKRRQWLVYPFLCLLTIFLCWLFTGQNIYNFAYYGLLSPLILPSYLLPFIKMEDYLMAVSIMGIAASVCLLYYWQNSDSISKKKGP